MFTPGVCSETTVEKVGPPADESAVAAWASGLRLSTSTVAETLKLITSVAKLSVADSIVAGVTLFDANARPTSTAASDEIVELADTLQYELDQDPSLSAWARGRTVVVDDIAREGRWPLWSEAVAPLSVASCMSVPPAFGDETFGAAKVYANHTEAFDSSSRQVLELVAAQAAVVMERAGVTEEDAMRSLISKAAADKSTLRATAAQLVQAAAPQTQ